MQSIKYVCPECGYESNSPGSYPTCRTALTASCPVCGNPVVGEQIQPQD